MLSLSHLVQSIGWQQGVVSIGSGGFGVPSGETAEEGVVHVGQAAGATWAICRRGGGLCGGRGHGFDLRGMAVVVAVVAGSAHHAHAADHKEQARHLREPDTSERASEKQPVRR